MFNKLFLKVLLSVSLSVAALSSANAALITQDILFDDQGTWSSIGEITVVTAEADKFGYISEWYDFTLLGFDLLTVAESGGGLFEAEIDLADFSAGLQFLSFDLSESNLGTYAFNGIVSAQFSFFDAFTSNGLALFGEIKLGDAEVSVPEPETAFLLLMAVAGLMVRRKSL
ncbi:PEP-CTERM sorting domain-containing protein [Thalassomonas actiniarum]|uniref:PEP-CTERM sorting domain-containing protein n=1 Tax=Thalassomonas actiniarum TaxID=485447 RepID=A0AAE9YNK7_9GAMM|nr:PEP-CTERM sorting domain-containing protein [Thalassomonas actiniarum]WDD97951.1 PEP-CTERM sorting domain-containing protein [Thalassomonas actiniarum]